TLSVLVSDLFTRAQNSKRSGRRFNPIHSRLLGWSFRESASFCSAENEEYPRQRNQENDKSNRPPAQLLATTGEDQSICIPYQDERGPSPRRRSATVSEHFEFCHAQRVGFRLVTGKMPVERFHKVGRPLVVHVPQTGYD